jgi:MFS family permease
VPNKLLLSVGCAMLACSFLIYTSPWRPTDQPTRNPTDPAQLTKKRSPAPLNWHKRLPLQPAVVACIASNIIFGVASTLVTVPQMPDMQAEAIARLPHIRDGDTALKKRRTNLTSATYTTFQNLGGVVGPLLGGVATSRFGVSASLIGTGVLYLVWAGLLGELCRARSTRRLCLPEDPVRFWMYGCGWR